MKPKSTIIISFLFYTLFSFGAFNNPILIEANENNIVSVFFPSRINKVIEPSEDFKFEYEEKGVIGVVKANNINHKRTSNFTVITVDGNIFSFELKYSNTITNLNFILTPDMAVGSIKSSIKEVDTIAHIDLSYNTVNHSEKDTLEEKKAITATTILTKNNINNKPIKKIKKNDYNLYSEDSKEYYHIFCENNYLQKPTIKNISQKIAVIELRLNDISLDKNEMYFTVQITNSSLKEYFVNDVKFYVKRHGSKKNFEIIPIYVFNRNNVLKANSTNISVYVLKNFKLSKDQKVYMSLDGFDENRFFLFPINNNLINR